MPSLLRLCLSSTSPFQQPDVPNSSYKTKPKCHLFFYSIACVCACQCVSTHMCERAYGGKRTTSAVIPQKYHSFSFGGSVSHWPGAWAPPISSTGFTIVLHHKQLSLWFLMTRLRSSRSQGKHIADGAICTSIFLPS